MFVIEKQRNSYKYVDYFHNRRFSLMPGAKAELKKMFEEQEKIGGNPEWLDNRHMEFVYTYKDTKVKVYIKEE